MLQLHTRRVQGLNLRQSRLTTHIPNTIKIREAPASLYRNVRQTPVTPRPTLTCAPLRPQQRNYSFHQKFFRPSPHSRIFNQKSSSKSSSPLISLEHSRKANQPQTRSSSLFETLTSVFSHHHPKPRSGDKDRRNNENTPSAKDAPKSPLITASFSEFQEALKQKPTQTSSGTATEPVVPSVDLSQLEKKRYALNFEKWKGSATEQKKNLLEQANYFEFLSQNPQYIEILAMFNIWQLLVKETPGTFKRSNELISAEAQNNLEVERHISFPEFIPTTIREAKTPDGYNWMGNGPYGAGYYKTRTSDSAKKKAKKLVLKLQGKDSILSDLSTVRHAPLSNNLFFILKNLYKFPHNELAYVLVHQMTGRETMGACLQRLSSGDVYRAKGEDLFSRNLRFAGEEAEIFRFSVEAQQIAHRFITDLESDSLEYKHDNDQRALERFLKRHGFEDTFSHLKWSFIRETIVQPIDPWRRQWRQTLLQDMSHNPKSFSFQMPGIKLRSVAHHSLDRYRNCPLQFFYHEISQVKENTIYSAHGSALHEAAAQIAMASKQMKQDLEQEPEKEEEDEERLERAEKMDMPEVLVKEKEKPKVELTADAFHDIYEKVFAREEVSVAPGTEKNIVARKIRAKATGKKIIEAFLEREKKKIEVSPDSDHYVEVKFRIKLPQGVELFGTMDNVEKNGDNVTITELKSTTQVNPPRPRDVNQVKTYALAYYRMYGILPRGRIESLTSGKSAEVPLTLSIIEEHEQSILDIVNSIDSGIFYPKPSQESCNLCSLKSTCPFSLRSNIFKPHSK